MDCNYLFFFQSTNCEVGNILNVILCMKYLCYLKEKTQKKVIKNGCIKTRTDVNKTSFPTLWQTIKYLTGISSCSLKVHQ